MRKYRVSTKNVGVWITSVSNKQGGVQFLWFWEKEKNKKQTQVISCRKQIEQYFPAGIMYTCTGYSQEGEMHEMEDVQRVLLENLHKILKYRKI